MIFPLFFCPEAWELGEQSERSVCPMSGSRGVRTAGLREIKQASSADKPGRETSAGGEGMKESEERALCSPSN